MNTTKTRFMSRLFSATDEKDEELLAQVAQDIQDAKKNGAVDTDEVRYEDNGDGSVSVIDKDNGEVTIAEQAEDGNFDLYAAPTKNLERFAHPEVDGTIPGHFPSAEDEDLWSHLETGVISPNAPDGGLNPMAGFEPTVEEHAAGVGAPCDGSCDEREFSVFTDNSIVLKIFSDQEFCERVFSEVIESEETANVGDLKIEKVDDDSVVVTSKSTGDQAKVTLTNDEMQIDELSSKDGGDERSFSNEEQYEALHVVGVDPVNHVIVDAPEYELDSAQELVDQLTAGGVEAVEIFEDQDQARDYAIDLLQSLGAENADDIEEPVQTEFSDHVVYCTKFYSSRTEYMERLYSEAEEGIETSQSEIEDAIENGEQIEKDGEIITPVDSETAVIEDKETGEFTKVTIDGDELDCKAISEDEADDLMEGLYVKDEDEDDEDEEEKEYSDYYDEDDYRLYSDLDDEDDLYLNESMYSDCDDLYYNEGEDAEEDYRLYSDLDDEDVYVSDDETKFFSESEELTGYQERLFSGEADENDIESAIETGEQIEDDDVVITPVDDEIAVIEDKESGEFTMAIMDDDTINTNPISEEVADKLTEGLSVEDTDEDEEEEEEEEKEYSEPTSTTSMLNKYFADIQSAQQQDVVQLFDAEGNPAPIGLDANGNPIAVESVESQQNQPALPSVEAIEDIADQTVNAIQQAGQEVANQILQAKQAPIQGQEQDLQEAQFSDCEVLNSDEKPSSSPFVTWLTGSIK